MPEPTTVQAGDLEVDLDRAVVTIHGRPVTLRLPIYRLLAHLARHKDTPIKKMDLLDLVYGPNASDPRLMDNLIKELRQALSPTHPEFYIKTVHAKGVMLGDPP